MIIKLLLTYHYDHCTRTRITIKAKPNWEGPCTSPRTDDVGFINIVVMIVIRDAYDSKIGFRITIYRQTIHA